MVNLPTDILRSFDAETWGRSADTMLGDLKGRIDGGLKQATALVKPPAVTGEPEPVAPVAPFQLPSLESFGIGAEAPESAPAPSAPTPFKLPSLEEIGAGVQSAIAPFKLPSFESFSREWTDQAALEEEQRASTFDPGRSSPGTQTAGAGAVPSLQAPAVGGDIEGYVRQAAAQRGIDPDIAVRVAQSEGGLNDPVRQSDAINPATGQREESYGPFQLYLGGGLGNAALQQGIDPRNPEQWRQAVDFALDNAAQSGWGAWYGAARAGIGNMQGIGQASPAGNRPESTPARAQQASQVDQAALDDPDKWALCGPVAAVLAAAAHGVDWTVAEAKGIASKLGLWNADRGMGGLGTEVALLKQAGVNATAGAADEARLAADAANGNTPIVSTDGHYYVLQGYDSATGKFDTGKTGTVYRGGGRWMSLADMERLSGRVQGAAYIDNPASPTPSVAAIPDKGAGLPQMQAFDPDARAGQSQPASDSERGPFDPPGYGETTPGTLDPTGTDPRPGDFPETPPAEVTQYPIGPRPGDFPETAPATPTFYPGSEPVLGPPAPPAPVPQDTRGWPGQVSDAAQGIARGGLNTALRGVLGDTGAAINQKVAEADTGRSERQRMAADLEASDLPEAAKIALRAMDTTDAVVNYLTALGTSAAYEGIRDTTIKPILAKYGLERHVDLPVLGEVGTADLVAGFVPGLNVLGGASKAGRVLRNVPRTGLFSSEMLSPSETVIGRPIAAAGQALADSPLGQGVGRAITGLRDTATAMTRGLPGGAPVARVVPEGQADIGPRPAEDQFGRYSVYGDAIDPGGNWKRLEAIPDDQGVVLYHATSRDRAESILRNGYDAQGGAFQGTPPDYVYLGNKDHLGTYQGLQGGSEPAFVAFRVPKGALEPDAGTDWNTWARGNLADLRRQGINPRNPTAVNTFAEINQVRAHKSTAEPIGIVDARTGQFTPAAQIRGADPTLAAEADRLDSGRQAGRVPGLGVVAQDADRYYHGTGSAFDTPDPATFDENGLFGPGYYLTSDPKVAGGVFSRTGEPIELGYAKQPEANLRPNPEMARLQSEITSLQNQIEDANGSGNYDLADYLNDRLDPLWQRLNDLEDTYGVSEALRGANVRAVDVPRGLRLLDAEAPVPRGVLSAIQRSLNPSEARALTDYLGLLRRNANGQPTTLGNVLEAVGQVSQGGGAGRANTILSAAGYDGISYSGGKRIPMTDADGTPIEHAVTVIFPESLPKITNATSGRPGGLLPTAAPIAGRLAGQATGGAVAGGYSASQEEGATPESVARGALAGAAGGAVRGAIGTRGSGQVLARAVGRTGEEGAPTPIRQETAGMPRQERAAELSRPIVLTDEEQIARIRLDKFPAELHDELLNAARGTGFGERLRRGVLSDEAVQTLAAEYGPTVESAIAASRRGRAYSSEEIIGLRNLMVGQTERTKTLATELAEGSMTRDERLATQAQLAMEQRKLALLGDVVFGGAPAEAGRALRQFRQLAQSLEVDPAAAGMRYLKQQFGTLDAAEEVSAKYLTMVQAGAGPIELAKYLRNAKGGWLDRLNIVRYAGMLSGTITHSMNAGGNLLMQGVDVATTPIAVGLDVARVAGARALGKDAAREIFLDEIPARLHGMSRGAAVGLQDAAFIMKNGLRPEDVTKLDHLQRGFGTNIPGIAPAGSRQAGAVDFIMEGPLRSLSAADAIFRNMAVGGHTAAEATARAMREAGGKKASVEAIGRQMDKLDVVERAEDLARRSVLQEDTAARRFAGWLRTQPRPVQTVVGHIVPFMSTPYSIIAQGVGMTPAGVVKAIADAKAGKGARDVEETLARVAIGTGVMFAADAQYLAGNLTGPRPEDQNEISTLPPGWREWSFKVNVGGQAQYIPMALAGPLAVPMVVGVLKADAAKKGQPLSLERLGEIALGIGRFASDQTFFQGISQLSAALDRGGSKIEGYIEQIASQYSPHVVGGGALGRQIQQVMGQPQRDPQGAIQALLAPMPYGSALSEAVGTKPIQARRDVLGRPVRTAPGGAESLVVRASVERDVPVIRAFRLANEGLPLAPPKQIRDPSEDGRIITLNRDQQNLWRIQFGAELQQLWQDQGQPSDVETLRKIEQRARDGAAARVLGR